MVTKFALVILNDIETHLAELLGPPDLPNTSHTPVNGTIPESKQICILLFL